jgi:hypothetical protein
MATAILDADTARLTAAVRLWTSLPDPHLVLDDFWPLMEALEAIDPEVIDTVDADVLEVAHRLVEGWSEPLSDLLLTARGIRRDTIHEFAITPELATA